MVKKLNVNRLLTVLFLMFVIMAGIILLPFMFASQDDTANSNNISQSEYADEYNASHTIGKFIILALWVVEIFLGFIFIFTVLQYFM